LIRRGVVLAVQELQDARESSMPSASRLRRELPSIDSKKSDRAAYSTAAKAILVNCDWFPQVSMFAQKDHAAFSSTRSSNLMRNRKKKQIDLARAGPPMRQLAPLSIRPPLLAHKSTCCNSRRAATIKEAAKDQVPTTGKVPT